MYKRLCLLFVLIAYMCPLYTSEASQSQKVPRVFAPLTKNLMTGAGMVGVLFAYMGVQESNPAFATIGVGIAGASYLIYEMVRILEEDTYKLLEEKTKLELKTGELERAYCILFKDYEQLKKDNYQLRIELKNAEVTIENQQQQIANVKSKYSADVKQRYEENINLQNYARNIQTENNWLKGITVPLAEENLKLKMLTCASLYCLEKNFSLQERLR